MAAEHGNDTVSRWIRMELHDWFHGDLIYVPLFEYLHHHHLIPLSSTPVRDLARWLWHVHEHLSHQPHQHLDDDSGDSWDWDWHDHGIEVALHQLQS